MRIYSIIKYFSFVLLLLCSFISTSQTPQISLKKGLVLIYNVENQNQKYDFTITVEEVSPSIIFKFKMSNSRRTSGKIILTKEALKSAIAQYNYFQNNEVTLTNQTTVWLSKKVWHNIKKNKKCFISTNSGEMNLKELDWVKDENYNLLLNGEELAANSLYCITKDSNAYKYWILDDPSNPLILRMELNFTIELKEIKYL